MKLKSGMKKLVEKHLKGDISNFKKEASEDKELIAKLHHGSNKKAARKHVMEMASKKRTGKKPKTKKTGKRPHEKRESPKHEKRETKGEKKFEKVMREFKSGQLHSGSKKGPKVTNPKQATAIAYSEARRTHKRKK